MITGDLGVGKTALAAAASDRLIGQGWVVSAHGATEARSGIAFAAFASLLDLVAVDTDPLQRVRDATERVLGAGGASVLVRIDDAQWLDPESTALVQHLAETTAVSLLLTVRAPHERAGRAMELARSLELTRLHLQPLSRGETVNLVQRVRPGVTRTEVQRLWELTSGNPLYLRELLAGAQEGIDQPGRTRLTDVVDARLDDLDATQREALELVAVGGTAPVGLLREVLAEEALVDLERRRLLVVSRDGRREVAALAHPVYGEMVAARMGAATRLARRGRLLTAMADRGRRRRWDVVQTAVWALEHGDIADPEVLLTAARWLAGFSTLGAEEADQRVPVVAGGLLAGAARLARAATDHGGGFAAAETWFQIESHRDGTSASTGDALARMGAMADGEEQTTRVLVAAATLRLLLGSATSTEVIAELEALEASVTDPAARRSVDASLAYTMTLFDRPDDALVHARRTWADPDATVADRLLAAGPLVASLVFTGRTDEALAAADLAIAELHPEADQAAVGGLVFARVLALSCSGRTQEADDLAEQCRMVAEATGNEPGVFLFGLARAHLAISAGRPADALAAARAAGQVQITDSADVLAEAGPTHAAAALALAELGRGPEAEDELAIGLSRPARTQAFVVGDVRAAAWVAVAQGRDRAAKVLLREAVEGGVGGVPGVMTCAYDLVRLGERGMAGSMASVAAGGGALWAAFTDHATALDAESGDGLDAAAVELAGLGHGLAAAEAAAQAAVAHAAAGAPAAALASGERSRAWAEHCQGAVTPALAGGAAAIPNLTERETEVARLAALQWTDKAIAEELCLSVRTVETYLHRIYTKVGIGGRSELGSVPGL